VCTTVCPTSLQALRMTATPVSPKLPKDKNSLNPQSGESLHSGPGPQRGLGGVGAVHTGGKEQEQGSTEQRVESDQSSELVCLAEVLSCLLYSPHKQAGCVLGGELEKTPSIQSLPSHPRQKLPLYPQPLPLPIPATTHHVPTQALRGTEE
jgi:hypothetical protein